MTNIAIKCPQLVKREFHVVLKQSTDASQFN